MPTRHSYIMRDQSRNQVGSFMQYDLTQANRRQGNSLHLVSVAIVSLVYLLSMTLAG